MSPDDHRCRVSLDQRKNRGFSARVSLTRRGSQGIVIKPLAGCDEDRQRLSPVGVFPELDASAELLAQGHRVKEPGDRGVGEGA